MANYQPPSEYTPVFDVTNFRETNDNNITQDDADRMYLSRQGSASSLATSTNFLGTVSCGGNLTLNAAIASNRQIEASFLKLVDNASISTNKPIIWNNDPSLQITTNDVSGALKTIDLKSYNGTATNLSTSLSCQYAQVSLGGQLRISQPANTANYTSLAMGAFNFAITNTNAAGNIVLNTAAAGAIIINNPIVPCDIPPAIFATRPSIGYNYSGTILFTFNSANVTSSPLISLTTAQTVPIGTYTIQACARITKNGATFNASNAVTLSAIILQYDTTVTNIVYNGGINLFERSFSSNAIVNAASCNLDTPTLIMTISTAGAIPKFNFGWADFVSTGFPSTPAVANIYWTITRIA